MSTETKILKHFDAEIISCKDYHREHRKICIICRDGKYGLAEKHENGKLTVIIDCEYDYIDTFCAENGFTNMIAVLRGDKWGLYAFRWTVSSKSNKIDCKQIAECEYDSVYASRSPKVAVLCQRNKGFRCRYYNLNSDRLSPFYRDVYPCDEHYFECVIENSEVTWNYTDIQTDSVIYSRSGKDGLFFSERITRNVYLFTKYLDDVPATEIKSDLVFFNKNLKVSYVIENIDCLNITRSGLEQWENNYIFTFRKDGDKHIISIHNDEWDIESIKSIAKEVE